MTISGSAVTPGVQGYTFNAGTGPGTSLGRVQTGEGSGPAGIAVDVAGQYVFAACKDSHEVWAWPISQDWTLGTFGTPQVAPGAGSRALVVPFVTH